MREQVHLLERVVEIPILNTVASALYSSHNAAMEKFTLYRICSNTTDLWLSTAKWSCEKLGLNKRVEELDILLGDTLASVAERHPIIKETPDEVFVRVKSKLVKWCDGVVERAASKGISQFLLQRTEEALTIIEKAISEPVVQNDYSQTNFAGGHYHAQRTILPSYRLILRRPVTSVYIVVKYAFSKILDMHIRIVNIFYRRERITKQKLVRCLRRQKMHMTIAKVKGLLYKKRQSEKSQNMQGRKRKYEQCLSSEDEEVEDSFETKMMRISILYSFKDPDLTIDETFESSYDSYLSDGEDEEDTPKVSRKFQSHSAPSSPYDTDDNALSEGESRQRRASSETLFLSDVMSDDLSMYSALSDDSTQYSSPTEFEEGPPRSVEEQLLTELDT